MGRGPLAGHLVVSLEQAVAAPTLSAHLADAGARVIKVERPEGDFARGYDKVVDGLSAYFVWLNRGKESIVLDIKDPGDAALLRRIIAKADVFVQNLAPGAAGRAGFGSDELRTRHPRLITCDISGYGEDGPYRDMKSYDMLVQVETGLASITGGPESPGRVGVSVCDIAAGLYSVKGVLEALIERGRTGRGRGVRVSLFDAMADWMTVPLLHAEHTGKAPPRVGVNHPTIAPYGLYEAGDGQAIVISIQNEREWVRLCADVLGKPDLATDPRFSDVTVRVRNRAELDAHIKAVFEAMGCDALTALLRGADIAYGIVNSVERFARHPHLRRLVAETEAGPVRLVAPPVRIAGEDQSYGPIPALGAHTEAIRREFAAERPE